MLYSRLMDTCASGGGLRGFSLLETLIALVLVGIAMTGLVVTFAGSGQLGVMGRRQATAMAIARSWASQLSHADYADARIANANTANDGDVADSTSQFEKSTVATSGAAAPDWTSPTVYNQFGGTAGAGDEAYTIYVNVAPVMDPVNVTQEMGRMIAVIVRFHVGGANRRAVALGYRYNPTAVGVGNLPL